MMSFRPRSVDNEYLMEIECARCDLKKLIISNNCAPMMLHLAFVDAGDYDAKTNTGGANGSIRFPEELEKPQNKYNKIAVGYCEEIKNKHPIVSYADLFQLAGVLAVEVSGGPKIAFVPGRVDTPIPKLQQIIRTTGGVSVLRSIFHPMGFFDKDIAAILGAHSLGRAHREVSGLEGPFTVNPYKFDNSFYRELLQGDIEGVLKIPTDKALLEDPEFKRNVQRYAECERTFFNEYAEVHKKMSELGFRSATPYKGGY